MAKTEIAAANARQAHFILRSLILIDSLRTLRRTPALLIRLSDCHSVRWLGRKILNPKRSIIDGIDERLCISCDPISSGAENCRTALGWTGEMPVPTLEVGVALSVFCEDDVRRGTGKGKPR